MNAEVNVEFNGNVFQQISEMFCSTTIKDQLATDTSLTPQVVVSEKIFQKRGKCDFQL